MPDITLTEEQLLALLESVALRSLEQAVFHLREVDPDITLTARKRLMTGILEGERKHATIN